MTHAVTHSVHHKILCTIHTQCSKHSDIECLRHPQAIHVRPFSEWVWQSEHFRQWSDSSGDLPNILGKVGRAAMGFGAALAICCHHQRNASQLIRSRNTIFVSFPTLLPAGSLFDYWYYLWSAINWRTIQLFVRKCRYGEFSSKDVSLHINKYHCIPTVRRTSGPQQAIRFHENVI